MRRTALIAGVVVLALAVVGTIAAANSYEVSDSVSLMATNWPSTVTVTIPKFNSALGNLTSIVFYLDGHVQGSAGFESEDLSPTTVTMQLSAMLQLFRPDSTLLVVTIPVVSTSDSATAFDGTIDYTGTSGKTYDELNANKTESTTSPPPSDDLTLFTATFLGENIILPVSATGISTGSGAGNLDLKFSTSASAIARVKYCYDAVPEPSGIAVMLTGLAGLGGFARLRRKSR